MTTKTKRDRAAGRAHRHTAIQGIIDDIASIDNSIASLQDENCNLGSRLDHWYTILDEKNTHTRQNVAYTMRCVVENERKVAEIEPALALLQEFSRQQVNINTTAARANELFCKTHKDQQKAIAQLVAYTNKVHGKQTNLNRELNLTRAAVDEVSDDLMWFGRLLIGLAASTTLGYAILFLIIIVK